MPDSAIEELARILLREVRDAAIRSSDARLDPSSRSPVAKRWQQEIQDGSAESTARILIPDIVDDTIFFLLRSIDQGMLRVKITSQEGRDVDLSEDGLGELAGWYMGSNGWRPQYSTQRFVDYVANLTPKPEGGTGTE